VESGLEKNSPDRPDCRVLFTSLRPPEKRSH
jgi:hypothetical protein